MALSIIKETLDIFFESTDVSDLDPLLIEFIQHDRALRDSRAATYVFFDTVSTDAVLLEELIRDRAAQYRYFRANHRSKWSSKTASSKTMHFGWQSLRN